MGIARNENRDDAPRNTGVDARRRFSLGVDARRRFSLDAFRFFEKNQVEITAAAVLKQ